MKIAVHQPNFLPYLGFWDKMKQSDIFVLLDNVQFEKNSYTNRCYIKTPKGTKWLTLPIKYTFGLLINEIELFNYFKIRNDIIKTIEFNYKKSNNFNKVFPILKNILKKDYTKLSDLNIDLILKIKDLLNLKTKIEIASNYIIEGTKTERLINICHKFNADTYLSGIGGMNYQNNDLYQKANINLEYIKFQHPFYKQLWGNFIPNLSIIDYLFNAYELL